MQTQAAAAKALGVSPALFNYWHNHAKEVPVKHVVAMKALLKSKKEGSSTLPRQLQKNVLEEIVFDYEPFGNTSEKRLKPISKRVELAMKFEYESCQERKSRKKLKEEIKNCSTGSKTPRLSEIAAKKFGLGSVGNYFRAKSVVQKGSHELIQAMDKQIIKVSHAFQILNLSKELQLELLSKSAKERTAFLISYKSEQEKLIDIIREEKSLQTFKECRCTDPVGQLKKWRGIPHHISKQIFLESFLAFCNQCCEVTTDFLSSYEYSAELDFHHFLELVCKAHSINEIKLNKEVSGA